MRIPPSAARPNAHCSFASFISRSILHRTLNAATPGWREEYEQTIPRRWLAWFVRSSLRNISPRCLPCLASRLRVSKSLCLGPRLLKPMNAPGLYVACALQVKPIG